MKQHIAAILGAFLLEFITIKYLGFTPLPTRMVVGLVLLTIFVICWTASKHTYIYAHTLTPNAGKSELIKAFEIHRTQMFGEYGLFFLLLLIGFSPLLVLGSQFVARVPFQGLINIGVGRPFVDPKEPKTWTVEVKGETVIKKKFLPGNLSYLKPVIGLLLIATKMNLL